MVPAIMPVSVCLEVTPPPPDSEQSKLSTTDFLQSAKVAASIKRRARLDIGAEDTKRIRFASVVATSPENDTTIAEYVASRQGAKIPIEIPFDAVARKMASADREIADSKRRATKSDDASLALRKHLRKNAADSKKIEANLKADLENEAEKRKRETTELKRRADEHEQRADELERRADELTTVVETLEADRKFTERKRNDMFIDNMLCALVKKATAKRRGTTGVVTERSNQVDPGHTRIVSLAMTVTKKELEAINVHEKYLKVLSKMDETHANRNMIAHESEDEFARYLLGSESKAHVDYGRWAPLFPVIYGKTVEEVAEASRAKLVEDVDWGI
ncbi:MAG: hypothetical protein M1832_005963 [Thelocarpon impressellum]|nr:MAG: hypothetical protein M1832_005963 [Thelocarpon impressellum]